MSLDKSVTYLPDCSHSPFPVLRAAALMRHGDNDDSFALDEIDDAEREAPNQRAPKAIRDFHTEFGMLPDRIDGVLNVIEKGLADRAPLRSSGRPRSSLPPREEGDDTRSPKPASRSGHCLIAWDSLHFAPAIGVVSAAGFFEPKLVYPRFLDRIELVDENEGQRRLFLAGKGAGSLLEVVELAAHAQIIGAVSCDC